VADFDYANARLRAMKSRLLPRRTLEALTEVGSVHALITALADTPYRIPVEAALARHFAEPAGMECLTEALRNDLIATIGKARGFFGASGAPGDLAAAVYRRYDLHNLKTILRGLSRHVPADEIMANSLPAGELRAADLAEMARAANLGAAIDVLATWRLPLARPLLELRTGRRNHAGEVPALELALDRWHLATALQTAREADEQGRPLWEALMQEADVTNILTALRLAGMPDLAAVLREQYGTDKVEALFVGPGHVPYQLLGTAAHAGSVTEAIDALAGTTYGATLAEAVQSYSASGRLSVFERALARRTLRQAIGFIARDALGIGVLLGYTALKTNELCNLRATAQGLSLGDRPEAIRAELILVEAYAPERASGS
jgi:V/A-type H+-transporting ATPase subunit C